MLKILFVIAGSLILLMGFSGAVYAQKDSPLKRALRKNKADSLYYISYEQKITARFYFSQKFTALRYANRQDGYLLKYQPNTTLNMGVGATYKWFTLNLAYGFGFLNPDKQKGKTKYLDLQFHNFSRKFSIDIAGQFYRGFFLAPNSFPGNDGYYIRPDMRVNEIGGTFQFIQNHRHFSYRAAFLLNEWQKRSAGTLLYGFEAYGGRIKADSSLVPGTLRQVHEEQGFDLLRFVEVGVNGGYAYTYVLNQHFFVTGSATVSIDYGFRTVDYQDTRLTGGGFSPNTIIKVFGGYNSAKWGVSLAYINNQVKIVRGDVRRDLALNTGNVRLNFVYRFVPNRSQRKMLEVIK